MERSLALLALDLGGGVARLLPQRFIVVPERPAEPRREQAPDRRLAGAHHADQDDVRLPLLHLRRSRSLVTTVAPASR